MHGEGEAREGSLPRSKPEHRVETLGDRSKDRDREREKERERDRDRERERDRDRDRERMKARDRDRGRDSDRERDRDDSDRDRDRIRDRGHRSKDSRKDLGVFSYLLLRSFTHQLLCSYSGMCNFNCMILHI